MSGISGDLKLQTMHCSYSVHAVLVMLAPMIKTLKFAVPVVAVAVLVGLSACTYRAGDSDNPIGRSFSWFSYLNADDLRANCTKGEPDRYRVVYNAVWQEQVRTYDFTAGGDGGELKIQVKSDADFARAIPLDDLLSPWRGKILRARLSRRDIRRLGRALRQSGFYKPVPQGTRVQSWGFFWVAAACEGGRFRFNVWAYPTRRFEHVTLARTLKRLDRTNIPFNKPRDTWEPDRQEDKDIDRYQLVVKGDGFAGNGGLF